MIKLAYRVLAYYAALLIGFWIGYRFSGEFPSTLVAFLGVSLGMLVIAIIYGLFVWSDDDIVI